MKIIKYIILFVMLTALQNQPGFSRDYTNPDIAGLKSEDGVLLVVNFPSFGFTFDVECSNFESYDKSGNMFLVDDNLLQMVTVPLSEFVDSGTVYNTELELLRRHREYERAYFEEVLNLELVVTEVALYSPQGKDFLFWEFNMPRNLRDTTNQAVKKTFFITTVVNDVVAVLSAVSTGDKDFNITRNFLKNIMLTIKISPNLPLSIPLLQESLKKKKNQ